MFRYLSALSEKIFGMTRYRFNRKWDKQLLSLIKNKRLSECDGCIAKFNIGDGAYILVWVDGKFHYYGVAYGILEKGSHIPTYFNDDRFKLAKPSIKTMLALDDYINQFNKKSVDKPEAIADYLKDNWGL